jgi:uncharacterized protein YndB with AHSA1/START domain
VQTYGGFVSGQTLKFSRSYDLPRNIVWDALIDDALVSGWLGEADIEARVGGRFNLVWHDSSTVEPGTIAALKEPELLEVHTSNLGELRFTLDEQIGGTRGTSTRLTISIRSTNRPIASTAADWITNLEQLESLLRGRPVDWTTWETEWGPVWKENFDNRKITKPL